MTKVTNLSQEVVKEKKKHIEFKYLINGNGTLKDDVVGPSDWGNVEFLCANYDDEGLDLFFAYDDGERSKGGLYLGNFNDGVTE